MRVIFPTGCFQSRVLLEGCINRLKESGFEVFTHSILPNNEGGIPLGQAIVVGTIHEQVLQGMGYIFHREREEALFIIASV